MISIEDIVGLFQDVTLLQQFSLGRRHSYPLVGRRLFIARGPEGEYEVFIGGSLVSFGSIQPTAGIDWGVYHEPNGHQIDALRLSLDNEVTNCRLISHLAYEALQRLTRDPTITNDQLLAGLEPYIRLISDRGLLSVGEQQGLLGELLLVDRLLALCISHNVPSANALDAWKGWQHAASRDFCRNGIVVEVKTTSKQVREHEIASLHQLERDPSESALYLFSLGVSPDPSGTIRLVDQADSLLTSLGPLAGAFDRMLIGRGYQSGLRQSYQLGAVFSLTRFTSALFEVHDGFSRLRPASFVGGGLPPNVRGVTYVLNLQANYGSGNPLSLRAADNVLLAMLR